MGTNFYTARNIFCSRERGARHSRTLTILLLALSGFFSGYSQTTPLSFTQIPYGNADLIAPGRGVEHWNGVSWDNNSGVQIPAGNTQALNYYARFNWVDIESSGSQGSYNWTAFDNQMHKAMDAGAMFSFGVMPMCSGCGLGGYGYPTYLHNLMQGEGSNSRDWQNSDGLWVPNWNSPNWLGRWSALMTAIANHISSTTYNGKNYKDAIYYIDVRGYGDYGEWHTYPWTGTEPSGRTATVASLESIVNAVKSAFPNYPLQIAMGAFDTKNASMMPPEFSNYVLTTSNTWGQIGWRRDNLGDAGYASYLSGNPGSYAGNSFSTLIMNKWKYAPIGGEPANDANAISRTCGVIQCDLVNEITTFHIASFGNGNYPVSASDGNLKANVTAASKASGYRLILSGGSMTTTLSGGGAFSITLNWQNIGVTPTYENWNVVYELRNSSGGVVWTGNSAFNPKLFLPQGSATGASDNFTLSSVSPGTYSMYLIVRDPANYKKPLPLAVNGRNSDGSYLLRSNITVGTGTANQSPTADAGSDKTIQLPTSTAALAGTGKDADGTVASYAWTKVSGPAGGTLSSPATANTNVSGMVAGVYVYSLTVTDNQGATGTAKVQITVNAAATANQSPVAKAGSDISISLPTNQVTLDGSASSDPDGSIASYAWAKISGPAQFSISNSSSASTSVKNLAAGVYSFQLKVTDNGGATALDTVIVTVTAATPQNQPPVANAGSNITVTLPTNVANLNGSASKDADGTISTYTWSQTSGPSTATIASASTVSTGISGLVQGSYNFMLKVTDNSGATDTNTVIITVNAAGNKPPVANAGNSRSITLPTNTTTLDGSLSSDPDGTIASYTWSQIGGPSTATITNGALATVTAGSLVAGQYTFELTVTDNKGAQAKAQVKISVLSSGVQPPIANAGVNQTISLPVNSVVIDGSGSVASSGNITGYTWTESSGPSTVALTNTAQNTLGNLQAGVYIFYLTVTDNLAAKGTDSVIITVNGAANQTPVADAGAGVSIVLPVNTATLDGSKSSDPDGTIVNYGWSQISGPNTAVITSGAGTDILNLSGLIAGQYTYQLKVTDNSGASSTAQVKIRVADVPNQSPTANAGIDQTITAPANTVNLDGSGSYDPDGSISSYSWAKVSGPGTITISNSNTATPSVIGLQSGSYVFELIVSDNKGATAKDQVTITVNPKPGQPNQLPVANAGDNLTITLPVSSINLNAGSSFDPDGTITAYSWKQVSGPSTAMITGGSSAAPTVSQLYTVGQYVFELTVTDNNGATSQDQVTVTVNPTVAKANQAPVADAGSGDTLNLPVSNYILDATHSTDPDGTISSYQWQELSGPNMVTSSPMNESKVNVSGFQPGDYEFQVTVTDNLGASSTATTKITVMQGSVAFDRLIIYPNPAHDVVNGRIISSVMGTVRVSIYDMNGRQVLTDQIEKSGDEVDKAFNISQLASGMYMIHINIGNRKTMIKKFIKN